MVISSIEVEVIGYSDYWKYQSSFRILVDGERVAGCSASDKLKLVSATGLTGQMVEFQGNENYEGRGINIEGGKIEWGINLADEEARDAAQNAKLAAESAESAANSANINAKQAKQNAAEAKSKANAAHNDADYIRNNQLPNLESKTEDAKSSADAAHSDAQAVKNAIISGTGVSGKSLPATYDKVASVENVANTNSSKLNDLDTKITNIENKISDGDTTPPEIDEIKGEDGATCTTTSYFSIEVTATDNKTNPPEYRAKIDGGSWSQWTSTNNVLSISSISNEGAHSIYVEVRDDAGNVSKGSITIFKV